MKTDRGKDATDAIYESENGKGSRKNQDRWIKEKKSRWRKWTKDIQMKM